ncbi:EAL domain-containing protein [Pandoraea sp. 64-18]|uniref:EAL domain-containing protein n=1 Tax=Pandoraea sp. 64-18 TaxID=1895806 RepID=UPI000A7F7622|nr:EAL domain-containing protein [Pandoraea sp. 64-18]
MRKERHAIFATLHSTNTLAATYIFDEHPNAAVTVVVASSLAGFLAASLFAAHAAVVLLFALSACDAIVYVGYCVHPKARLRRAVRIGLRRGEFHVVYQPIVDMCMRHCVGVEALLRWGHPKFGAAGPGQFIGKLEGSRLLGALTRFVLREATNALSQPPFPQHWHISVNVCARHLMKDGFVEDVCESAGPMLERLILELTERSCVERTPRVVTALGHLRQRAVHLSLDDFGTGVTNFDLLADFRFDYVKVDRRFLAMRGDARIQFLKSVAATERRIPCGDLLWPDAPMRGTVCRQGYIVRCGACAGATGNPPLWNPFFRRHCAASTVR